MLFRSPYKVVLQAEIQNTYYHYGQTDQVTAPGLKQTADAMIADVEYLAIASTDKPVYLQGENVQITGTATSTIDNNPMPNVPVRIGISSKGFDRNATAISDATGTFTYTFTPSPNEAGGYSIWATHPDLPDRTVQAQYSIIGLQVSPQNATIQLLKGKNYDIPVTVTNLGGSPLTGLTLAAASSSGMTATTANTGATTLNAGETRTITFRVGADLNAPAIGLANLYISTQEGLTGSIAATITTISALPVISTSPSYTDTGLMRGNQRIENLIIKNNGAETLYNPRIEGPSLPWVSLAIDKNIGDILSGQSKTVGIMINPGEEITQGIYNDRLVIYSDNHIPYTYNVQVTVTSSAVGNVQFSVLNELIKDVAGASITFQNQSVLELIQTIDTDSSGTATVFDLPEGRYSYNISAPGALPTSGSFIIVPGTTTSVPIALELTLVKIEWSVTPVTITDSYDIRISQTYETNVPTPVLVVEPAGLNIPDLQPGQVFNGELTVSNYGLITLDNVKVTFPSSVGEYDIELMSSNLPKTLAEMQKVVVPYRITRRVTTAANTTNIGDEISGYGGGTCYTSKLLYTITGTAVICPNSPQQKTVEKKSDVYGNFPSTCGTGGGTSSSSSTYSGSTGSGYTQGGGGSVVTTSVKLPCELTNPCDCVPEGTSCTPQSCDGPAPVAPECKKYACQGGACSLVNNDGAGCDDKRLCTSYLGIPGQLGQDKCKGGKCLGKEIEDKPLGPDYTLPLGGQFALGEKVVAYLNKLMNFIPGDHPPPQISYSESTHAFRRCCEASKALKDGQEGALGAKVSIPMLEYPILQQLVPIPAISVPVYVKVAIKIGGEGTGTIKTDDNPCDDNCSGSTEVGVNVTGGLSGTIGTPDGIATPDPLLSVEVSGSVNSGGYVSLQCDGGVKGKICLGHIEAEIKAMATNWTMGAAKITITEGYCFQ